MSKIACDDLQDGPLARANGKKENAVRAAAILVTGDTTRRRRYPRSPAALANSPLPSLREKAI